MTHYENSVIPFDADDGYQRNYVKPGGNAAETESLLSGGKAKFLLASAALKKEVGNATTPSTKEYLTAMEQKMVSDLIYVGWLGVQFNLDCFTNPINAMRLERDFEGIHREGRMSTLPMAQQAQRIIDDYNAVLPAHKRYFTSDIIGFYTYLQTMGYKLAHYFGFQLANWFLRFVIPGYACDVVATSLYTNALRRYLDIDTLRLTAFAQQMDDCSR